MVGIRPYKYCRSCLKCVLTYSLGRSTSFIIFSLFFVLIFCYQIIEIIGECQNLRILTNFKILTRLIYTGEDEDDFYCLLNVEVGDFLKQLWCILDVTLDIAVKINNSVGSAKNYYSAFR